MWEVAVIYGRHRGALSTPGSPSSSAITSLSLSLLAMASHGVPSHSHEEILSVFSDEMRNLLNSICRLHPPYICRITPHGQLKLEPVGTTPTIPDSVILARINMVLFHLMWIEVCFTQTTNKVFEKVCSIFCPRLSTDLLSSLLGCSGVGCGPS